MQILDKVGDTFNLVLGGTERFITNMFGSSNERRVRNIGILARQKRKSMILPGSFLDRINRLEPDLERLSDGELRETASKMRQRLAAGETLDMLLPKPLPLSAKLVNAIEDASLRTCRWSVATSSTKG